MGDLESGDCSKLNNPTGFLWRQMSRHSADEVALTDSRRQNGIPLRGAAIGVHICPQPAKLTGRSHVADSVRQAVERLEPL
jgi:hypothetical protein